MKLSSCSRARRSFQQMRLGHVADVEPQLGDVLSAQAVVDELALAPVLDQARFAQCLEMGARQAHVDARLLRERLHRLLALGEQFDQLEPLRAGERLADAGDVFVKGGLGDVGFHAHTLTSVRLLRKAFDRQRDRSKRDVAEGRN